MHSVVHHAIKRFGSPPAAIPRRATRRVATRQRPQAYPPRRGTPNLEREYPNARLLLINNHKCAGNQRGFVLPQCCDHQGTHMLGKYILAPHLEDAGSVGVGQGEERSEIQVVRENRTIIGTRPGHDCGVGGARVANSGLMNGFVTVS